MNIIKDEMISKLLEESEELSSSSLLLRMACVVANSEASSEQVWDAGQQKRVNIRSQINDDVVASMIARLRTKAMELEHEYRQLSLASSSSIGEAMEQYRTITVASSDIQRGIYETISSMQRLGADYSERIDSLVSQETAYLRICQTMDVLRVMVDLLSVCREIDESIQKKNMYHAAKMYAWAVEVFEGPLKTAMASRLDAHHDSVVIDMHERCPGTRDACIEDNFGSIAPIFLEHFCKAEEGLDRCAMEMVSDWLAWAGQHAEQIGSMAIGVCEDQERNKERCRALEADVVKEVMSSSSFESKVAAVSWALKNSGTGLPESTVPIELSLLRRAITMKKAYSNISDIQEKYVEAREAQLGSLLVPPEDASVEMQRYLRRIVGFFLIEQHVYTFIPDLETRGFVEDLWDGAAAGFSAELGAALDEVTTIDAMLSLKSGATFACASLRQANDSLFSTSGIEESMLRRVGKLRQVLSVVQTNRLVEADGDPEVIRSTVDEAVGTMRKYFSGLVPISDTTVASLSEMEKLYSEILLEACPVRIEEEYSIAEVDDLIKFIELTSCIQNALQKYIEDSGYPEVPLNSILKLAVNSLGKLLASNSIEASMLSKKTLGEICSRKSSKNESDNGLISPWSDALSEQAEFWKKHLKGFCIPSNLIRDCMSVFIEHVWGAIADMICTSGDVHAMHAHGAKLLREDILFFHEQTKKLGGYTDPSNDNYAFKELTSVLAAISTGNVDLLERVDSQCDSKIAIKRRIQLLKKVVDSPGAGLSRKDAQNLAKRLQSFL